MELRDNVVIDMPERKEKRSSVKNTKELILNTRENGKFSIDTTSKIELLESLQATLEELIELEVNSNEDNFISVNENKRKQVLKTTEKDIIYSKDEEIRKIKKGYEMKLNRVNQLNKVHIEFLLVSAMTIILSLIGLLVFSVNGFYIIHPSLYILGIFMGLGWGATCITSIITRRR